MKSLTPKTYSPFGEAALALDYAFSEFERRATEIEKMNIQTDRGLERALTLLEELDGCGKQIGEGLKGLTSSLETVRARAEQAAQLVGVRAEAIQSRRSLGESMAKRITHLGEMVREVTSGVEKIKPPKDSDMTTEEKSMLAQSFEQFRNSLGILLDEATKLKQDAHDSHMEIFERNADTLRQSLQSARHRLKLFVDRHTTTPADTRH